MADLFGPSRTLQKPQASGLISLGLPLREAPPIFRVLRLDLYRSLDLCVLENICVLLYVCSHVS